MGRGKQPSANLFYGKATRSAPSRSQKIFNAVAAAKTLQEKTQVLFEYFSAFESDSLELAASEQLHEPNSPTDKRYQGFVVVEKIKQADGAETPMFVGLTKYGPGDNPGRSKTVEIKGHSLASVLSVINEKLDKKLSKSRSPYIPLSGSRAQVRIESFDVENEISRLLKVLAD